MPMYVIERNMSGVGAMTDDQAQQTTLESLEVLDGLGEGIQWFRSFVLDNKIYCLYQSPDEAMIRQHAEKMGLPADRISEVRRVLDPATVRCAPGTGTTAA
ncbi:MAG: DUF4242 domain-containing protein [Rhodanobacteraceae bacterium]